MNRIIFITRDTKKSGKGHFLRVSRMLASLSPKYKCILVVDNSNKVKGVNYKSYPLDFDAPDKLCSSLKLGAEDILWFDIPDSDYHFIERYKDLGIPIVSMNMFERLQGLRFEDVAIYPVFEKFKRTKVNSKTIQLSGAEFINLPGNFFYSGENKHNEVLVSMGGTDPMGFTPLVLEAIASIQNASFVFRIILPKYSSLEEIAGKYKKCTHIKFYEFGELDFANELKSSKYALINGGMTRYECVAAETHFIALSIHKVQESLSEKVTKYGFGTNFGVFDISEVERLKDLLSNLPNQVKLQKKNSDSPSLRPDATEEVLKNIIQELSHENE